MRCSPPGHKSYHASFRHAGFRRPTGITPLPEGAPCNSYNCECFVCCPSYLFVRAPFEKTLTVFAEEGRPDKSGRDPSSIERVASAKSDFGGSGQDDFPGFLHGAFFFSYLVRAYDPSFCCFLEDNILRTLCARSIDGRHSHNCSSTESVLQPAGYHTMQHDVLYCSQVVAFIGAWHPSSRKELVSVSDCLLCVLYTQPAQTATAAALFALLLLLTAAAAKQRCHCHRQPKCIYCLVSTKRDPTKLQPQPSP